MVSSSKPSAAAQTNDPLLYCVLQLAHLDSNMSSAQALIHGLPLEKGKLTPELCKLAAARIGYTVSISEISLDDIHETDPPCILLMDNDQACLVTAKEGTVFTTFWLASGAEPKEIPFETLALSYTGIYLKLERDIVLHDYETGLKHSPKDHWLWGTLYQLRSSYWQIAFAAFLTNMVSLVIPLFALNVYDRVIPNASFSTLTVLAIGAFVAIFFDFLVRLIKTHFIDVTGKKADLVLSRKLLEHVLSIKLGGKNFSIGSLVNHLREAEVIREFFSSITLTYIIDAPFVVIFLSLIGIIAGLPFLAVMMVFIVFILVISWVCQRASTEATKKASEIGQIKNSFLVETIMGLEDIKAMCSEGRRQRIWERIIDTYAIHIKKASFFSSMAVSCAQFIQNSNYITLIIFGVFIIVDGKMTVGGLIACTILASRALVPFSQAAMLLMRFNHALFAYQNLNKVMNLPSEKQTLYAYTPFSHFKGGIRFEKVSFRYLDQQESVLKDISFEIQPKEKVAFVGRIGAGKTTLCKLILGIYQPTQGSILADGLDFQQINPADLRSNIGYVSQEPFLFTGSILENIVLERHRVTPEHLENALTLSGVHDFTKTHPQGLERPVGEGGNWLSGGQKQAVTIARALAIDPSLLLFDEPTSMMDQYTQATLLTSLKTHLADKTVIIMTHSSQMLELADRVIWMENGIILFNGSKQEFSHYIQTISSPNGGKNNGS